MNTDRMTFNALKRLRISEEESSPVHAPMVGASFVRTLENIFGFRKPNTMWGLFFATRSSPKKVDTAWDCIGITPVLCLGGTCGGFCKLRMKLDPAISVTGILFLCVRMFDLPWRLRAGARGLTPALPREDQHRLPLHWRL